VAEDPIGDIATNDDGWRVARTVSGILERETR
jgi:hypothetical protein